MGFRKWSFATRKHVFGKLWGAKKGELNGQIRKSIICAVTWDRCCEDV